MRKALLIACFLFIINSVCTAQIERAVQPRLSYTTDIATNISGAGKQKVEWMGLIDAGMLFNSDSANLWKGGQFNFGMISTHGKGITNNVIHDLQGISFIEAGNHPLLFWELWYHQQFGKLGIRGGLQNLNDDFMSQPYTDDFSGSSYGMFPTLSLNYSLATYPVAGLGISFSYEFNQNWYIRSSLFNGKVSDLDNDRFNTKWSFNIERDGFLSVSELKYTSDQAKNLSSTYALGTVFHNKPFSSIRGGDKEYKNNYTFYGFAEHDIYRTSTKNVGVFLQGSYALKDRNIAYGYTSAGFVMAGFLTPSHTDKMGIGLSQLYFQEVDESYKLSNRLENTIEVFLSFEVNKYLSIKPTFFTIISSPKETITAAMLEVCIDIF